MKKMIIVCSDKRRKYGDYLAQLISSVSNNEDSGLAGTSVVVWSLNDYKSNSAQLSSDQYILFIGNDKMIKEKRTHMKLQYDKYNMKYGWLGRQASLNVGYTISLKEYSSFQKYYKELASEEMSNKSIYYMALLSPALAVIPPPCMYAKYINEVRDQLYSCLTYAFFTKGLKEFLAD